MSLVPQRAWPTIAAFMVTGALGPLGSVAMGSLSPYSAIYVFVDDVVWLLWPSWGLAVMEASLGTALAAAIAIGANLLLFATLGVLVAGVRTGRFLLAVVWATCLVVLCAWAWFGAGRAVDHVKWGPLIVAGMVLTLPFGIARRVAT